LVGDDEHKVEELERSGKGRKERKEDEDHLNNNKHHCRY
jgi:hypothetical protein